MICPIIKFHVTLDADPSEPYYAPGSRVRGSLSFHVTCSVGIFALRVKLVGQERVQRGASAGKAPYTTATWSHKVRLVNQQKTIYGSARVEKDEKNRDDDPPAEGLRQPTVVLKSGWYTFPFRFRLPDSLPPSCVVYHSKSPSDQARVDYFVKAYVDTSRPGGRDAVFVAPLRVVVPMTQLQATFLQNDANRGSTTWTPLEHESRCACVSCGSNGQVNLRLCADRHVAWTSPEPTVVKVTVHIENKSSEPLRSIALSLRNRIVVRTHEDSTDSVRLSEFIVLRNRVQLNVGPGEAVATTIEVEVRGSVPLDVASPASWWAGGQQLLPPSMVSHLIRSKWFIVADISPDVEEERILGADGCCMPMVVTDLVVPSASFPPIDLVKPVYPLRQRGEVDVVP